MPDIYTELEAVADAPILDRSFWPDPVTLETVELLRRGDDEFVCRVRTTDGLEGWSVGNGFQLRHLYPIFPRRLAPYFVGQDVRDLESLIEGVYIYKGNYKLQGLALWVPLATLEFAILDLLGKLAGRSIGSLLGPIHQPTIGVYRANNFRGQSAEESLASIQEQVQATGAKALKFKIGSRMGRDIDDPPRRTERLISMIRRTFGEEMTVYADANGGYSVAEAVRIGRLMEEQDFDLFEEPVPFDDYVKTQEVTRRLTLPIAGGEQETGINNFRWLIANDALDVVQPDPFYFGGMIRSLRVARMAAARGKLCVPHISNSGLGYLYMMHFVSALKNAGPYHEFKGFDEAPPIQCETSDLVVHDGRITVPTAPGLGVTIDAEYLKSFRPVTG